MLARFLCRLVARLLFRVRLEGSLPAAQPERLVVIANHQSFLDGALVQACLPYRLTWVVHTQIAQHWYFRLPLRLVPHLLVDTANALAMKKVIHLIEAGCPIVIFPEGRITATGGLMKVYDGPAFLASRTGAWLLPVTIDGAVNSYFTRMQRPFPKKLRPQVTMKLHALRQLPMPVARTGKQRRRLASLKMQRLLEETRVASRRERTLFEALLDAISLYGRGAPILEDIRFQEESYGWLLKASLALGRLVSRLASEGETVGVLMPNANPTVALLFGLFAMRRVPALLNYTAGVEGMQSACRTACIRTVITSRAFLERAKLTDKVGQLRDVSIVCLEDLRSTFGLTDKLWLLFWALRFPRAAMRRSRPQDPAVVLFTSGSEGKPKGVVLSHAAVLANIAQLSAVIEFSNRDRFLVALPVFHSFGLTGGVLLPMVSGARVFLYPSPLHYRIVPEMAYDRDCTVLFGTGTFLAHYARFAQPYDFYRIRYVIAGAEKLSEEVRRTWMDKFGLRILEGYGTTECAPAISLNTPMAYRDGSVGVALPEMESRLVPIAGIERGGALHVRGPNMMLGYLLPDRPGEVQFPASSCGSGWYDTGDVVDIDADGFLHIVGRMKRFAKVAGEMVSLEVVETIAAAASPGRVHGSTTVVDPTRGETIVLYTEDPALRREHLLASARQLGHPEVAVARRVEYLPQLPRLGIGKIDYAALRGLAESQRLPVRVGGGS